MALLLLAAGASAPALAQRRGWELAGGGVAMATERALDFEGRQEKVSGLGRGAELTLSAGALALRVRAVAARLGTLGSVSALAAATIGDIDARVQFQMGAVGVEGGYLRRVVTGQFSSVTWTGPRAGGRLELALGEGPFSVSAAAGYAPSLKASGLSQAGKSIDFESALRFRARALPIWLSVGYRIERRELPGLTGTQFERISGVLVAGGLSLRGGSRPQR